MTILFSCLVFLSEWRGTDPFLMDFGPQPGSGNSFLDAFGPQPGATDGAFASWWNWYSRSFIGCWLFVFLTVRFLFLHWWIPSTWRQFRLCWIWWYLAIWVRINWWLLPIWQLEPKQQPTQVMDVEQPGNDLSIWYIPWNFSSNFLSCLSAKLELQCLCISASVCAACRVQDALIGSATRSDAHSVASHWDRRRHALRSHFPRRSLWLDGRYFDWIIRSEIASSSIIFSLISDYECLPWCDWLAWVGIVVAHC